MKKRFLSTIQCLAARCAGALLALPSLATHGQVPAAAPQPPCRSAEYRQFDFWIGEWDVYQPDGKKAGESRIESISGGCALLENWSGQGGFSGKSLNSYDRADKRWHQNWVDSSGSLLVISGGLVDKRMVLTSAPADPAAPGALHQRISWTPNDDGSVRQLWEASADAGRSWAVQFDGRYVRRRPG